MKIKAVAVSLSLCLLGLIALASCGKTARPAETTAANEETELTAPADAPEDEETEPVEEPEPASETAAAEKGGAWVRSYKAVLDETVAQSDTPTCSFALIWLDDDDTPELVIQPADYHLASARLYTFDGSEAVDLGEYGSWGQLSYLPGKGVILSGFGNQGIFSSVVSELKGGKVTELCSFTVNERDEENSVFSVNDKDVSKAEYDAEYDKYVTGELVVAPNEGAENTYPLTAAGVEAFASAY